MPIITQKNNCQLKINSPNIKYTDEHITSNYQYDSQTCEAKDGIITVTPQSQKFTFQTERKVPKVGIMLVGIGGNNGTTVAGGIIANKHTLCWKSKRGEHKPDYLGSLTQASTVKIANNPDGNGCYIPIKNMLPMVDPAELVIGGWDINKMNLGEALVRAEVFEYDLIQKLMPYLSKMVPLPSIYYPDFIASNQEDRADNILPGSNKQEHLEHIRRDIREFKAANALDKVIILWTANTERFSEIRPGLNDTTDNLMKSIKENAEEVSPSTIFALASLLEGCPYINGSPQNTFVPGVIEFAENTPGAFICGDDFKSGQTKMKSVLVDFLIGAGIKPTSIVSYNHLGNNDGKNLSAPSQFRSKEISKSNVVDDLVNSNEILYEKNEKPDHCVVIKYVPYVGDSKRALDEYTSQIFMGGHNTIVLHNTCEDSLLAAPLIIDLVVLTELFSRIKFSQGANNELRSFHPILSVLSYLLKAPLVPRGTPIVNALFKQRACIENILRACLSLPPDNNMTLEHKTIARK